METKSPESKCKVACFGAGFVGLPTSAVLALHNPQVQFIVYDINEERVQICKNGIMPIFQPQLKQTVEKVQNNLKFTSQFSLAVDHASVIFLALPTPTKQFGENAGKAYDLSYTEKAIDSIILYYNEFPNKMKDSVVIVQKSTVPIGTARMITKKINSTSIPENKNKYVIVSNPEFLAEGTAIADLMNPDRIVIGLPKNAKVQNFINLYGYAKDRIITTNQFSSELSKLAANCFLAQKVSSINSMAIICEHYEADISQIKSCIGSDKRIGDKFLNSSVGFGGSCFQKDILALVYLAELKGLQQVADYWMAVINMNNYRKRTFFLRLYNEMNSNLKGKKISVLGVAFKQLTSDARQSPAIDICYSMLIQGAILRIYDPQTTNQNFISEMIYNRKWKEQFHNNMIECNSAAQACESSSAIVLLTEWDQFKQLDYSKLVHLMKKPFIIFDGRNILDEKKVTQAGFRYCRIGKAYHSS